jgi:hypothetical protein
MELEDGIFADDAFLICSNSYDYGAFEKEHGCEFFKTN